MNILKIIIKKEIKKMKNITLSKFIKALNLIPKTEIMDREVLSIGTRSDGVFVIHLEDDATIEIPNQENE